MPSRSRLSAPRHRNSPRPAWKVAEAFREWLRKRCCACQGRNPDCGGRMVAAHVDYAGKGTPDAKGTGSKVADRWNIPLTDNCHKLQHNIGWPEFDRRFLGGERAAKEIAAMLWQCWPGRIQWERKLAQ